MRIKDFVSLAFFLFVFFFFFCSLRCLKFYLWCQHERDLRRRKLKKMHNARWILRAENMVILCVCIHSYIDFACHFNRNFGILYARIDLQQLDIHAPTKMKRLSHRIDERALILKLKQNRRKTVSSNPNIILIVFQFYKSIN